MVSGVFLIGRKRRGTDHIITVKNRLPFDTRQPECNTRRSSRFHCEVIGLIYLPEHHAGFDASCIGFPSISGCHAIVLHSDNGLYGYHALGGERAPQTAVRATGFASFVRQHNVNFAPKRLYGACFLNARGYSGNDKKQGWITEITAYADALGMNHNLIRGFDLGTKIKEQVVNNNTVTQSAYVEMRLVNDNVEVFFKRWSKMKDSNGAAPVYAAQDYKKIHQTNGSLLPPDQVMEPVEIIETSSNKGKYHKVSSFFGA